MRQLLDLLQESIFRRKPVPDLIRDVQRFAAENATKESRA